MGDGVRDRDRVRDVEGLPDLENDRVRGGENRGTKSRSDGGGRGLLLLKGGSTGCGGGDDGGENDFTEESGEAGTGMSGEEGALIIVSAWTVTAAISEGCPGTPIGADEPMTSGGVG